MSYYNYIIGARLIVLLSLLGCNKKVVDRQNLTEMKKNEQRLVIKGTVEPSGTIGYGYLYKCTIGKILDGELDEKVITLVILSGDHENYEFISTHEFPTEIEIEFKLKNTNEPYVRMPLTGFVDMHKTSWEIVKMK